MNSKPKPIVTLWIVSLSALGMVAGACATGGINSPRIEGHVYDFFQRAQPVRSTFGLYTYVLLPDVGTHSRNIELLEAIINRTSVAVSEPQRPEHQLNLFVIPVTDRKGASEMTADAAVLLDRTYDYNLARSILEAFCARHSRHCNGPSQGPYLLTYDKSVTSDRLVASERWLLVDLSKIHQRAFPHFVVQLKSHLVTEPDFTSRFQSLDGAFLNIVLTSADILSPLANGIRDIISWFGLPVN